MDKQRSFSVYLLWAFGIAWVLQVMAGMLYRKGNGAAYTIILAVSMFAPMLAVLLTKGKAEGHGLEAEDQGKHSLDPGGVACAGRFGHSGRGPLFPAGAGGFGPAVHSPLCGPGGGG